VIKHLLNAIPQMQGLHSILLRSWNSFVSIIWLTGSFVLPRWWTDL